MMYIVGREAKLDNGDSFQYHTSRISSMDIDISLDILHQDDSRLVQSIRKHYLYPPSRKEYNFSMKSLDLEGQSGQAKYIANNFFVNYSKNDDFRGFFSLKQAHMMENSYQIHYYLSCRYNGQEFWLSQIQLHSIKCWVKIERHGLLIAAYRWNHIQKPFSLMLVVLLEG